MVRLFSRAPAGPVTTPEYERVWIAFAVDRGARSERIGFSQQNMDAFAAWLPMLVADSVLCGFGELPEDGLRLLNDVSAFADDALERIARAADGREQLGRAGLATRARDWSPAELSPDAFQVHCEIDLWEEEERIKVNMAFTPPEAATPQACRELVWIAWDWVADGSGLHPSRAAAAAAAPPLVRRRDRRRGRAPERQRPRLRAARRDAASRGERGRGAPGGTFPPVTQWS